MSNTPTPEEGARLVLEKFGGFLMPDQQRDLAKMVEKLMQDWGDLTSDAALGSCY